MPDPRPTPQSQSHPADGEASATSGRAAEVEPSATPLRTPDVSPASAGLAPAFGAGLVSRPRLLRRLGDGTGATVVLVAAPAGHGKTTLLADWARRDGRPFAWIDVDDSLDDPSRLVAAVTVALDACSGRRSAAAVTRLPTRASTLDLRRLDRCLESRPPFVLVLDDAHRLRREATLEVVRALAAGVPAGSQVALATRTALPLPVGRMRAHRMLIELRADELAMTPAEAGELLAMAGAALGPRDVETLVARTDGWPACLYLAAVALREAPDVPGAVAGFAGDDALVAAYMRDEVLGRLPPRSLAFLRRASVVERLSGDVCDALLERCGSAVVLDELAGSELLLRPLDRRGEAHRLPRPLADVLRSDLRRLDPEAEPPLQRRAAAWHVEHGELETGIEHAIASGDAALAGPLLLAAVPTHVSPGRDATLQRWLGAFTPAQTAAHPALALATAHRHLVRGELDAVQQWEAAARGALASLPRDAARPLRGGVELLRAAAAPAGVAAMGDDAAQAYELEPEDSPWRALCCLLHGVSLHLTGSNPAAAEARLEEGARRGAVAAPNVQTLCLAQLALLAAEREDWEGGAALAARARAQVERTGLDCCPTSSLVYAAAAALGACQGRVDDARADGHRARELLGGLPDFAPWYDVEARLALARAALRLGDLACARELLVGAHRRLRRVPDAPALNRWASELEARVRCAREAGPSLPCSFTTAELRVVGFLPTHLTFKEIADCLFVSANTVKTQAHAVYRKLDVSSRSEAVSRAVAMGLLDRSASGGGRAALLAL